MRAKSLFVSVLALLLASCDPEPIGVYGKDASDIGDTSTEDVGPGGDADIGGETDADVGADVETDACVRSCEGRECGSDGCGGQCGPGCTKENYACDERSGQCECEGELESALCELAKSKDAEIECGTGKVRDRCDRERDFDCGVDCVEGLGCDEQNKCRCIDEPARATCNRYGKTCGTFNAVNNCRALTIGDCSVGLPPCAGMNTCSNNVCRAAGAIPSNDRCSEGYDPEPLTLVDGEVTVELDLRRANDDAAGSCGGGARDAVFSFTLDKTSTVKATLSSESGQTGTHSVYIRALCDEPAAEFGCASGADAEAAEFELAAIGPGTFFVWIDAVGNSSDATWMRALTLRATPLAKPVPDNDKCLNAELVPFNEQWRARVTGDTTAASDDFRGCGAEKVAGKDLFYMFIVSEEMGTRNLSIQARFNAFEAPPISVSLLRGCNLSTDLEKCVSVKSVVSKMTTLNYYGLEPGTWYVGIDTASTTPGPFEVQLDLPKAGEVPENDACGFAENHPISFPENRVQAHLEGTTEGARDDWSPTRCYSNAKLGSDVLYQFTVEKSSMLFGRVTSLEDLPAGNEFVPVLYLFEGGCEAGREVHTCGRYASNAEHHAQVLEASALEPGTYYVVVDSLTDVTGRFALDLYLGAPVTNDTCETAIPLDFGSSNTLQLLSDTRRASNDIFGKRYPEGGCDSSTRNTDTGNDVVWSLELPAGAIKNLIVKVTPLVPGDGAVYPTHYPFPTVRKDCGASISEVACVKSGRAGEAMVRANRLEGGAEGATWYIWEDGAWGISDDGPFTIELTLEDATFLPNDTCATAVDLVEVSPGVFEAEGNTVNAKPDTEGGCKASRGADLVYRLPLTGVSNVQVQLGLPSGSLLDPVVYVRKSCGAAESDLICGSMVQYGLDYFPPELILRNLALPEIFIFVDSTQAYREGAFTLSATVTGAHPPPTNDLCDNPELLAVDPVTHSVVLNGLSTASATPNYTGSCQAGTAAGLDLVYKIVVGAQSRLMASVRGETSTFGWKPVLYLRKGACAPSAPEEVACAANTAAASTGGFASISAHVAPETYYLFVDAADATVGTFALELSVIPEPLLPDSCGVAQKILFDGDSGAPVVTTGDTGIATHGSASVILPLDPSRAPYNRGNGPDLVYRIDMTVPARISAKLAFLANNGEALLYLRPQCTGTLKADELAVATGTNGGPAVLTTYLAAGKSYYLWVDSTLPLEGPFDLVLTVENAIPQPAANLSCEAANAAPALLHDRGTVTVTHSTIGGANNATANCKATPGAESVYLITIPAGASRSLYATVTRIGEKSLFDPVLYIRSDCASGLSTDEKDCKTGVANSFTPNLTSGNAYVRVPVTNLERYYLFVDSAFDESDAYQLTVMLDEASPPKCDQIGTLKRTFTNGHMVIDGLYDRMASDSSINCPTFASGGTGGGDQVYAIDTGDFAGAHDLVVNLEAELSVPYPSIYLRKNECGAPDAPELCDRRNSYGGGNPHLRTAAEPNKTYYLWVDSGSVCVGKFKATLDLVPTAESPVAGGCENAISLTSKIPAAGGAARISGTTADGSMLGHPRCAGGSGREKIYSINLAGPATVEAVAVATPGSFFRGALELRSACATAASTDDACATPLRGGAEVGAPTSLRVTTAQGGLHYLWVDTLSAAVNYEGDFDLTVVVTYGAASRPESCATATAHALAFTDGVARVTSSLTGASDAFTLACGGGGAPDLVYPFHLDTLSSLSAVLTGACELDSAILALRGASCTSAVAGDQLGCDSAARPRLFFPTLASGDYWLVVDGKVAGAQGLFTLDVRRAAPVAPATNETCQQATSINLDGAGRASREVAQIAAAANDASELCGALPGPDLYYKVFTPAGMSLRITATPSAGDAFSDFAPALAVTRECGLSTGERCAKSKSAGSAASLLISPTEEGDYYIAVDAVAPRPIGSFVLDLLLYAAPRLAENDDCTEPFPQAAVIEFQDNYAAVVDTLGDATDSTTGTCDSMPGPDKVFRFTLSRPQDLQAIVQAESFPPAIYLRKSCGAAAEVSAPACIAAAAAGTRVEFKAGGLAEGTYYLWIDTRSLNPGNNVTSYGGAFWIDLLLTPATPVPTNDSCDGADELDLTGAVPKTVTRNATSIPAANTMAAGDDSTGGMECGFQPGADQVYTFEVAVGEPRSFTATFTPITGNTLVPTLYLRKGNCASGDTPGRYGCVIGTSATRAITMTHARLEPGRYYLWVDTARRNTLGAYMLTAEVKAPEPQAPLYKLDCSNLSANKIEFDEAGLSTVTKTFTKDDSEDTTSGSCASARGPEFAYELKIPAGGKKLTVTPVTTPTSVKAVVYLRTSCADASLKEERGCSYDSKPLVLNHLAAGTYALIVDFLGPDAAGSVTLNLKLEEPITGPANNLCSTAQMLTLGETYYGNGVGATNYYQVGRSLPNQPARNAGTTTVGAATTPNICPSGGGALGYQGSDNEDVVFKYTPTTADPFSVIFSHDVSISVWINKGCDDIFACEAALLLARAGQLVINRPVAGQTYYIILGVSNSSTTTTTRNFSVAVMPY